MFSSIEVIINDPNSELLKKKMEISVDIQTTISSLLETVAKEVNRSKDSINLSLEGNIVENSNSLKELLNSSPEKVEFILISKEEETKKLENKELSEETITEPMVLISQDLSQKEDEKIEDEKIEDEKTEDEDKMKISQTISDDSDSFEDSNDSKSKKSKQEKTIKQYGWSQSARRPEINVKKLWKSEEALTLEERRARYRCRKAYTTEEIPTWADGIEDVVLVEKPLFSYNEKLNKKIALFHGDITTLEIDAIVNAANESCLGGGGVDGSIHRAAGDMLYEECRTLHGCPTGECRITRGHNLPAKYVLHTVGPMSPNHKMLESAYSSCLKLVEKHKLKTVAFCGVSTGIFGFPLYPASNIALKVIRTWLEKNYKKVDKIIICTYLARELECYLKLTPSYFPPNVEYNEKKGEEEAEEENEKEEKVSKKKETC